MGRRQGECVLTIQRVRHKDRTTWARRCVATGLMVPDVSLVGPRAIAWRGGLRQGGEGPCEKLTISWC